MRSLSLVALMALLAASCSSFLGPSERSKLNAAREVWEEAGLDDYDYRIDHHCFCGIFPYRALVQVRDGEIVAVVDADTGETPQHILGIPTIPELFERIDQALDTGADEVNVTYDAEFGFPSNIQLDYIRQAIDDELEIRVEDFEAVR